MTAAPHTHNNQYLACARGHATKTVAKRALTNNYPREDPIYLMPSTSTPRIACVLHTGDGLYSHCQFNYFDCSTPKTRSRSKVFNGNRFEIGICCGHAKHTHLFSHEWAMQSRIRVQSRRERQCERCAALPFVAALGTSACELKIGLW